MYEVGTGFMSKYHEPTEKLIFNGNAVDAEELVKQIGAEKLSKQNSTDTRSEGMTYRNATEQLNQILAYDEVVREVYGEAIAKAVECLERADRMAVKSNPQELDEKNRALAGYNLHHPPRGQSAKFWEMARGCMKRDGLWEPTMKITFRPTKKFIESLRLIGNHSKVEEEPFSVSIGLNDDLRWYIGNLFGGMADLCRRNTRKNLEIERADLCGKLAEMQGRLCDIDKELSSVG